MKTIKYPNAKQWNEILTRPAKAKDDLDEIVKEIFDAVKNEGDDAINRFTEKFDNVVIDDLIVSKDEIEHSAHIISQELKNAIQLACNNIEKFHLNQTFKEESIETSSGVECWRKSTPIEKVGLYIPGGTAPLFSTVLMLGIPARIAGCEEVILCTPPDKNGKIHPAILFAARCVGVTNIIKAGGIQAIAGLTYGCKSMSKVHKIFGPGNQFVTAAKERSIREGIAIDMPAGPSEVLVFADETANPAFIAADMLSQAEHGADSQSILVTTEIDILEKTKKEIQKQLKKLPRKDIAEQALKNSKLVLIDRLGEALDLINDYAPEHFIVMANPVSENFISNYINNAGSVFLGNFTPESAGDYASGTNHTLPTNGFAKAYSGVSLDSFTKKITFQKITREGLENIGPTIELMAETELLEAHKRAVSIRLESKE